MASKMVTYAELDDDEFEYSMRNRSRGAVYIINNYLFDSLPARNFSGMDRDSLLVALKFVGFRKEHIEIHENLTAEDMLNLARKAAMKDYSKLGCLFFIVLSHGDEESVCGVDGEAVGYEDLLFPIRSASTGRLEGIPKILLVQACKVGMEMKPTNNPQGKGPRPPHRLTADDPRLDHDSERYGPSKSYSTSAQSDFLIAYSVIPGEAGGSRFIQAFCEVMRRDGRRVEATMILATVSRLMSYTAGTSMPDKSVRTPCVISQLKKGLYFS